MSQTIEIPLTRGYVALIDSEDYARVSSKKWYAATLRDERYVYAFSGGGKAELFNMHRFVCGLGKGDKSQVDHINHNTLDNRRANLRLCSHGENQRHSRRQSNNRSGYKGVYWKPDHNRWLVEIRAEGKAIHIGYFTDKIAAAIAYDEAAKKYHGEFAFLNFPTGASQ